MRVLVTELLVARIVQWMLRPAAVVLWLGTLIVSLHSQPVPPPPSPAQIKDVQIPKLTSPPRIEQFLGGASRADLRRIDDFRQRQPGDGVPVSRKTSAWIGYDDRNFYAGEMFSRPVILASCGVKPEIPAFRGKTEFRPGLDAKAVIHDTLTLDVALNPDFSQVESDDPAVTVNHRFEVVFPEKRPFFLENNSYFTTPENLFFSRRIVDPEFGGRITGKLGQWDLGVLAIDDRAAGAALDPADPNYGGRAEIGVVRVLREFGKSNLGLLVTDRQFAGSYNRVASLDTRLKFNDTWTFAGQVMTSQTRELDGTQSGG